MCVCTHLLDEVERESVWQICWGAGVFICANKPFTRIITLALKLHSLVLWEGAMKTNRMPHPKNDSTVKYFKAEHI